jgi:ADP-ribose pyrophosphatase YjhB (NUDIX family)
MYKIFVNNKPITLTTDTKKGKGYKTYKLKRVGVYRAIRKLNRTNTPEVRLTYKKESKLLSKFLKKLPNVMAGGGKVYNDEGKVLFIYRNDKWDLPKGKAEKGEGIEETAIREVEEETMVKGLEIVKPLEVTYHIFKRNGHYKIKITHWFEMKTSFTGELNPQKKEGITKVKWLSEKKIEKALENSYANIKLLF